MDTTIEDHEVWLDPSSRILNLKQKNITVTYPDGMERKGGLVVLEPPAGHPAFGKCCVKVLFSSFPDIEWTDHGSPQQREIPMLNPEKGFLAQAAIDLIRPHPLNILGEYLLTYPS